MQTSAPKSQKTCSGLSNLYVGNWKKKEELERVSCIWYFITFKDLIKALLDWRSKVNAISQAFAFLLGLTIWKTNVVAQKIDGTTVETYKMIVSTFSMSDKDNRERFFEKSFLLANVKPEIVFGMPFLTMSNADIDFQARNLQWRSYTTRDILSTTRQVELIGNKEFVAAALDAEYEAFVVHLAAFSVNSDNEVHPSKKA